MTKKSLVVQLVFMGVGVVIVLGLVLLWWHQWNASYEAAKLIVPVLLAAIAAWAAFVFQRRNAFLSDLRRIFPDIVKSAQKAITYCNLDDPTLREYRETVESMSYSIDVLRCVFLNHRENNRRGSARHVGLYPIEPLKMLMDAIRAIPPGKPFDENARAILETAVIPSWKLARNAILQEFDRGNPAEVVVWGEEELEPLRQSLKRATVFLQAQGLDVGSGTDKPST